MAKTPEVEIDFENPLAAALRKAAENNKSLAQTIEEVDEERFRSTPAGMLDDMVQRMLWRQPVLDSMVLAERANVLKCEEKLKAIKLKLDQESTPETDEVIDQLTPTRKLSRREKKALQSANRPKAEVTPPSLKSKVEQRPQSARVVRPTVVRAQVAKPVEEAAARPELILTFSLDEAEKKQKVRLAQEIGWNFFFWASNRKPDPDILSSLRGDFARLMNNTILRVTPDQGQYLLNSIFDGMGLTIPKNDPALRRTLLEAESKNPDITKGIKSIPGWDKLHFTFFAWGLATLAAIEDKLPDYYKYIEKSSKSTREEVGLFILTWQWYKENLH